MNHPTAFIAYRCPVTNKIRTVSPQDYTVRLRTDDVEDGVLFVVSCICGQKHELSNEDGLL